MGLIHLSISLCLVCVVFCRRPEVLNDRRCRPTSPDILGPYYYPNAPFRRMICNRDSLFPRSEHVLVSGKVLDENCSPIANARIEVWQADHDGHYRFRDDCRGHFVSGGNGRYAFLTEHPGKYSTDPTRILFRPAHVHFRVQRPGFDILVTQMYFKGDPSLGSNDSCDACSSDKSDLVVDINRMCGDDEGMYCFNTVHFDIVLRRGNAIDVVPDEEDSLIELDDAIEAGK